MQKISYLIAHRISTAVGVIFYGVIVTIILQNIPTVELRAPAFLVHRLFRGDPHTYIIPGAELAPFKPYLPKQGSFSFIMDQSLDKSDKEHQMFFWSVCNYLCPILLNQTPVEPNAIVFCSTQDTANQRLKETGYRWRKILSDGKGLAEKI
jgi:hypothetical protein